MLSAVCRGGQRERLSVDGPSTRSLPPLARRALGDRGPWLIGWWDGCVRTVVCRCPERVLTAPNYEGFSAIDYLAPSLKLEVMDVMLQSRLKDKKMDAFSGSVFASLGPFCTRQPASSPARAPTELASFVSNK